MEERKNSWLAAIFRGLALVIIQLPWLFILGPLLITLALGYCCTMLRLESNFRVLFTPSNAPSKYETKAFEEFWSRDRDVKNSSNQSSSSDDGGLTVMSASLLFVRPHEEPILYKNYTDLIKEIDDYIRDNLTFAHNGTRKTFSQLCAEYDCPKSTQGVRLFFELFYDEKWSKNERVKLTFPIASLLDNKINLAEAFNGLIPKTPDSLDIAQMRLVKMSYIIAFKTKKQATVLPQTSAFSQALISYVDEINRNGTLRVAIETFNALDEEFAKNADIGTRYFGYSMILLSVFWTISCFRLDGRTGKIWEGAAGCVSSFMALISGFGLLAISQEPINGMVICTLFLVLAVGGDDTFIMISTWQTTDRRRSPSERLVATLEDAGSSLLFTAITDVVAFGFGGLSTTPAVRTFCISTAVCLAFDFLYQVTFLAAVVYYGGCREANDKHYCCCCLPAACSKKQKNTMKKFQKSISCSLNDWSSIVDRAICWYCDKLQRWYVSTSVIFCTIVILLVSLYGCSIVRPNLTAQMLVTDGSPAKKYHELVEKYFWSEGLLINFVINRPTDFNVEESLTFFIAMMNELESTKYSMGPDSTQCWATAYYKYLQRIDYVDFYERFDQWLELAGRKSFKDMMVRGNVSLGELPVKKFICQTGFHKMVTWDDKFNFLRTIRRIVAAGNYTQFNATPFHFLDLYIDQVNEIPNNAAQMIGCSVGMLFLIAFVFVPSLLCFYALSAMLAINIGVVGMLALSGAQLDPISVAVIDMCVGLSVDFVAHVTLKFHTTHGKKEKVRATTTVRTMLTPTLQGAFSTFFGVLMLAFIPSYMFQIIFWTVALVLTFGLWYSVVLLPVIFTHFRSPV